MEKKKSTHQQKGGELPAPPPQETHRAFCREAPEKATAKTDASTVGF